MTRPGSTQARRRPPSNRDASRRDTAPQTRPPPKATETAEREEHLASIDNILDEIDGVLEECAEEFVRNYVQKGGQ